MRPCGQFRLRQEFLSCLGEENTKPDRALMPARREEPAQQAPDSGAQEQEVWEARRLSWRRAVSPEPGERGHDWEKEGRMTLTSQSLRELSATAPHRGRAQLAAGSAGTEQVHVHHV